MRKIEQLYQNEMQVLNKIKEEKITNLEDKIVKLSTENFFYLIENLKNQQIKEEKLVIIIEDCNKMLLELKEKSEGNQKEIEALKKKLIKKQKKEEDLVKELENFKTNNKINSKMQIQSGTFITKENAKRNRNKIKNFQTNENYLLDHYDCKNLVHWIGKEVSFKLIFRASRDGF